LTATDTDEVHKYFQSRLTQGTTEQRTVARYGMGLIALNGQNYKEAEAIFLSLTKELPGATSIRSSTGAHSAGFSKLHYRTCPLSKTG